jgi:predicted RNA-binding Zn-ribbon protein involved in translation (DUF1610 family)
MVMSESIPQVLTRNAIPDIISTDLITSAHGDGQCPKCGHSPYYVERRDGIYKKVDVLEGPYTSYERRESELYFDMTKKYFHCSNCGEDVIVFDYQVMSESVCSMLPPEYARKFSMKNMRLYDMFPELMKLLLSIVIGDFESEGFMDLG